MEVTYLGYGLISWRSTGDIPEYLARNGEIFITIPWFAVINNQRVEKEKGGIVADIVLISINQLNAILIFRPPNKRPKIDLDMFFQALQRFFAQSHDLQQGVIYQITLRGSTQ